MLLGTLLPEPRARPILKATPQTTVNGRTTFEVHVTKRGKVCTALMLLAGVMLGHAMMWPTALLAQQTTPATTGTSQVNSAPVPSSTVDTSKVPTLPAYDKKQSGTPTQKTEAPQQNGAPAEVTVPAQPVPQKMPPPVLAEPPYAPMVAHADVKIDDEYGSAYIPVDSWVYPAVMRLYSLGFVDSVFLGIRPWTRRSVMHMLDRRADEVVDSNNQEAIDIYEALRHELVAEGGTGTGSRGAVYGMESAYTRVMDIAGPTLRNSYHLGNSIVNDYGRPYAQGFNNVTGFSSLNEEGRFSLYVRAEYQHAPASNGYTLAQAMPLQCEDEHIDVYDTVDCNAANLLPVNYAIATVPIGRQAAQNPMRVLEATISGHVLGHELSFGKTDAWLGTATGGGWAWSNNADNIYGFRIDRVEPLHVPYLSRVLGPFRYEFFVGALQGHNYPNSPYVHMEKISFKPTSDVEFGIERTVIWGGHGHEPVTIHTFLKSFFSFSDVGQAGVKNSAQDPGARFSAFDASWRLPYLTHWLTWYVDSEAHDDVNPISAPRRADFRTGLYLSHVPELPKLDLRVEGADSDQATSISHDGQATYWEVVQEQGYTNKGQIMGDWLGREGKGGQAWLTYHLSGNEQVQLEYRRNKDSKDFFPGGTTQNQIKLSAVLRAGKDIELKGYVQYEEWKAPYWMAGQHSDTTTALQVTWFPKLKTSR